MRTPSRLLILPALLMTAMAAFAQAGAWTQVQSAQPAMKLTAETRLHYDHYDPLILNEHAVRLLREGDDGTAEILLQRALRLAPGNRVIRHNLQLLEGSDTQQAPEPPQSTAAMPQAAPSGLLPEPPAPWPEK